MGKPILPVTVQDVEGHTARVLALFDTGSHPTLLRQSCLPPDARLLTYAKPREFRTPGVSGNLSVVAVTHLVVTVGERMVEDDVLISPDLRQEMIVGAGTMQKWDISIRNANGDTSVVVGRDLRDPDVTEVDHLG
ncbi:MAG: hypothetical protein HYZ53_19675 [Planctomycetes bacterium]|nr:hypothetical protein [Planctomycetota bacterium]